MKKIFLMFLILLNYSVFSQENAGLYFVKPVNGQSYPSVGGYCHLFYKMLDPGAFYICLGDYQSSIYYPSSYWSEWIVGKQGYYDLIYAGEYKIKGRVWVCMDLNGQNNYWLESSEITFYVIDNEAPTVPQNFIVSTYSTGENSYPKLNWTLNGQLDVLGASEGYLIERKISNGSFTQIATVSGITNEFIDYSILTAGNGSNIAEYRIRAKDVNGNISGYSNIQEIHWGTAWKKGTTSEELINKYKLFDNYPNPFNPSTTISYQVPSSCFVKIKVFNSLGNEVTKLVDGYKEAGSYQVKFDAANLPSGLYVYRIETFVNETILFSDSKRMIYLK